MIADYGDSFQIVTVKRILIKNGRVAPGLPGFVQKGDGKVTCMICGKALPDQLSAARNIGPECIKTWGSMPGREFVEEHVKAFKSYQRKQKKNNMPVEDFAVWLKTISH